MRFATIDLPPAHAGEDRQQGAFQIKNQLPTAFRVLTHLPPMAIYCHRRAAIRITAITATQNGMVNSGSPLPAPPSLAPTVPDHRAQVCNNAIAGYSRKRRRAHRGQHHYPRTTAAKIRSAGTAPINLVKLASGDARWQLLTALSRQTGLAPDRSLMPTQNPLQLSGWHYTRFIPALPPVKRFKEIKKAAPKMLRQSRRTEMKPAYAGRTPSVWQMA
jgi:hypothetical protein